ncbi:methylated-DNA--cysteine S-met [Lentinula lateritia]|uniref:Methylated-DNA--cysteine S-met n=1 Tax=Lentinula aff. lateritia TaxID=2804960 RepID=A0ACC1TKU6_9AGAR|nr:methylated-DNA--cysteine S-met [Lentinula aff. lateritia]KAJ3852948.1 methylated-DNA--cysteine S-met [Lentinula lateritia]
MPAVRSSAQLIELDSEARVIYYPASQAERATFRTINGKRLTEHQWNVYDFTKSIPSGQVSTYAEVCRAVGGSPRSVGNALRHNPFAPCVPCHRVIASSLYIGGFVGEWGPDSKTKTQYHRKVAILKEEGVIFTEKGFLKEKERVWKEGKNLC